MDLVDGQIPETLEIDPSVIHRIANDRGSKKGPSATYRYIFALRGPGRTSAGQELHDQLDNLEKVKDSLHDRVLDFQSGEGNGIFALYMDYPGTAERVLDVTKKQSPNDPNAPAKYSPKDQKRIDKIVDQLEGTKIVIIRGVFDSEESFAIALAKSLEHNPQHKYNLIDEILNQSILTPQDLLVAASIVSEQLGQAAERLLPNIPPAKMLTKMLHNTGKTLHGLSGRGNNGPRVDIPSSDLLKTHGPIGKQISR